ncbi:MAG TPA: flagellar transcriptional regulator FlhD [Burkholderiales bacterium]|nr:flagellar transcriptional regulator FlhD [Burkholderiales bacterium]
MISNELLDEIREANLSYLLLAQRMIKEDKPAAMFRLGVTQDVADLLERLNAGQIMKMAASNMLLCRFRFDNRLLADMLVSYSKDRMMASAHAAVLMAGQSSEPLELAA